jgi:hypothetical protein
MDSTSSSAGASSMTFSDSESIIVAFFHFINPIIWILLHPGVTILEGDLNPWILYTIFFLLSIIFYFPFSATEQVVEWKREHDLTFGEMYGALLLFFGIILIILPYGLAIILMISVWSTPPLLLVVGLIILVILAVCCCSTAIIDLCIILRRIALLGFLVSFAINIFAISLWGTVLGPWAYWSFAYVSTFIFAYSLIVTGEKT